MKDRTELELLLMLKEHLTEKYIKQTGGLCVMCAFLNYDKKLTYDEALMLQRVITGNIKSYKIVRKYRSDGYFWKPCLLKPRIRYVNWLIEQHKPSLNLFKRLMQWMK